VNIARADDGALQAAYQAAVARSSADCAADDLDRIWQAVTGQLDVDARRDLIDRMAVDPALAQAWRVAVELDRARGGGGRESTRPAARWLPPAFLGIAAALILVVGAGVLLVNRPPADTFRAGTAPTIESSIDTDAPLPRDAFALRWTPAPAGARYAVRVTTEDLQVLATANELTAAEYTVPRDALAAVPAGGRVLWQVIASVPGGETISSRTFVVRVR
jgi:hypothetical protein